MAEPGLSQGPGAGGYLGTVPEKVLLPEEQRKEKANATRGSKGPVGRPSEDPPWQPRGELPPSMLATPGAQCPLGTGPGTCTQDVPLMLGKDFHVSRKENPFTDFLRLLKFKIPHSYCFYTKPSMMG